MKILIVNGPNLNMLGVREPQIYGHLTLEDINDRLYEYSQTFDQKPELVFFQSNHEGAIVDKIQEAPMQCTGIIINPGAYTHTSVAIADAIKAVNLPAIEVHLSNIAAREDFRQHSYIAPACIGQVSGLGADSYKAALLGMVNYLNNNGK